MTISYSREVCNVRLCGFAKLLIRWRGSIYKLMFRECFIFLLIFYALSMVYRFMLGEVQRKFFESLVKYCNDFTNLIPVTFVLGFYINLVVKRWWEIYLELVWPDKALIKMSWLIKPAPPVPDMDTEEKCRKIKRTLARYLNLMTVLTYQSTSVAVKKRFPTTTHLIDAGLMTNDERNAIEELQYSHPSWWLPAVWYNLLLREAIKENYLDEGSAKNLNDDMLEIRQKCANIWNYDWISVPLVYTQVVTWAVYTYIFACVMGRQFVFSNEKDGGFDLNKYVPLFTLLQFFFYVGWLKVAEQLVNPLGEDDDDFEVNWLIDRNLQTSFLIVDGVKEHPPLVKDIFWGEAQPELPYTAGSAVSRIEPFMGSANELTVTSSDMKWDLPADLIAVPEETDEEAGQNGALLNPAEKEPNTSDEPAVPTNRFSRLLSRISAINQQPSQRGPSRRPSVMRMNSRLSQVSAFAPSRRGSVKRRQFSGSGSPGSSKPASPTLGRFQVLPGGPGGLVSRQVTVLSDDSDVFEPGSRKDISPLAKQAGASPRTARDGKLSGRASPASPLAMVPEGGNTGFYSDGLSPTVPLLHDRSPQSELVVPSQLHGVPEQEEDDEVNVSSDEDKRTKM